MKARTVAMGGVFAALAVVIMLLGGLIPVATFACPMLASGLLAWLRRELPLPACLGWYGIVALLSALLGPDKEAAFVFLFLGWYPLLKPRLDRLPKLPALGLKLLVFFAAIAGAYGTMIFLFRLEALVQEARTMGKVLLLVTLLLGAVTFLLFDFILSRLPLIFKKRKQ